MKKIIIAFDGTHFSEGAFEFARRLNEVNRILLVGVFLPQTELANLMSYSDGTGMISIPLLENSEPELVQKNIERFEKHCLGNSIDFRVHTNFIDFAMPEFKKESRFADLMILGSEVFYQSLGNGLPGEYLTEALHEVSCPVLVVPEKFNFPNNVILTYDGSDDSVFAIKQFIYLFPELTGRQTILVYATENGEDDFPEKIQMEELLARHFNDLNLFKMNADPKKYFNTWVADKKNSIVVSGSFGRSGLSRLFRKSFINDVIADHKMPVFIAHK